MAESRFEQIEGVTEESYIIELRRGMIVRVFFESGILQLPKDWDWEKWVAIIREKPILKNVLSMDIASFTLSWEQFLSVKLKS